MSALDAVLPDHTDSEVHQTTVAAPPEVVWEAMQRATAREFPLSALLMAIRSLPARLTGRPGLAGDLDRPLVGQLASGMFTVLVDDAPRAFVAGIIAQPWDPRGGRVVRRETPESFRAFAEPGFLVGALAFEIEPADGGCVLRTETRVRPTDRGAALRFAPYWLVVKPFSGLIRRDMLRGIRGRAESAPAGSWRPARA